MAKAGSGKPRRQPTVADVATRAGVSIGTVSHVLSGKRNVAPATRKRTLDAIDELGYRPNRAARSLMLQRTETLGMVVPDMANPFFGELMRGVELAAREWNYAVLFGNTDHDPKTELSNVRALLERNVDGLLITVAAASAHFIDLLPENVPVIAVDRLPEDWHSPAVVSDNRLGLDLAVGHLMELGHKRIGFVRGSAAVSTDRERSNGFEEACRQRGVESVGLGGGEFSLACGYRVANELFSTSKMEWPTAVIASNDVIALGILQAAAQEGVDVPGDLSVVGNDDIPYSAITMPPLTTVRQPVGEMGMTAVGLLLDILTGRDGASSNAQVRRVLRPSFEQRASTAPPRPAA